MKTSSLVVATFVFTIGACSGGSDDGTSPEACTDGIMMRSDPPPGTLSGLEEIASFGDNPAGLKMYLHLPAGKTSATAVVLALHGCTQGAADYAAVGWNDVGDREGLAVVYAEQSSKNNSMRCFRWWDATQIGREGEARSLASMVVHAQQQFGARRAFVTGLSAGGAMTAVMLASYPDLFEAGAIMSGLPYRCATSQTDAYTCMSGRVRSADEWAALVPAVATAPRVSIWQGDADWTVRPQNREELVKQWTRVNAVSDTPAETTTEGRATHHVHRDASGVVRVESWEISKMGHGVALDPKVGCGRAGAYALDVGACSTEHVAAFFLGASTGPGTAEAGSSRPGPTSPAPGDPCSQSSRSR